MQYYKLMYDYENDLDAILVNISEKDLDFDRYDVNQGKRLSVGYVYCKEAEGIDVNTDYIANNLAWLIISEKLKTILSEFNIGDTQFIPVLNEDKRENIGYLVNIINMVDAIDISKSLVKKMTYHRDGKEETYNSVIKYALYEKKIGDSDLFKLEGYNTPIFISERLKNAMDKAKVTGCDYQKIKVS